MRFVWLARRHPVRAPWAQLIATLLTVAMIMAISQPLVPLNHTERDALGAVETSSRAFLIFLAPTHSPSAVRSPTRTAERPLKTSPRQRPDTAGAVPVPITLPIRSSPHSEPPAPQPQAVVTLPTTTVPAETGSAAPSPDVASPSRDALGPRWVPLGVSTAHPLTAVARDSVLAQLSSDVPRLAKTLRPTRAETDVILREQSMLERVARELNLHATRPTIGAAVSAPFPLFSPVPSRKKQVQDSIVNAEVLRQIAVITKRARAKQDSLRHADSLGTQTRPERLHRATACIEFAAQQVALGHILYQIVTPHDQSRTRNPGKDSCCCGELGCLN